MPRRSGPDGLKAYRRRRLAGGVRFFDFERLPPGRAPDGLLPDELGLAAVPEADAAAVSGAAA